MPFLINYLFTERILKRGNLMGIRTDLVIDTSNMLKIDIEGADIKTEKRGEVKITRTHITKDGAAERLKKPKGKYITIEFPPIDRIAEYGSIEKAITDSLCELLPKNREKLLAVGLGNTEITADSIGPDTISGILATRHLVGGFAESIGLKGLKSVAAIAPGVLGKTGIEVMELIAGAAERIKPSAVIVIDALASGSPSRLFTTVQLCDTGISPGSGVKNSRKEISEKTLGIPVIAVGVPTVVDAAAIAFELTGKEPKDYGGMIVTPKDIDVLSKHMSEILSRALNVFFQPEIEPNVLFSLV